MQLTFDPKTVTIEIGGLTIETNGAELRIKGVRVPTVLDQLCEQYDGEGDDVRITALGIALLAFAEGGISKLAAKYLARDMALLAANMLQEFGAGDWDFAALVALKKIRRSDHEIERIYAPRTPKPEPFVAPIAAE